MAELLEFRVTFGQRFHRDEHPTFPAAHPDGWVTILAADRDTAHRAAMERLGQAWGSLYQQGDDIDWSMFPRGELARWDAV